MKEASHAPQAKTKRPHLLEKFIFHSEAFLKGMLFDCQTCGQCVLRKTGLVCPMSCPKGLRNGPCGGTLDGKCEIYNQSACVWVRIHQSTGEESFEAMPLLRAVDYSLFKTSSFANLMTGKDVPARTPLPSLEIAPERVLARLQTHSSLEQKLKAGEFVKTCEIRSPRENDWAALEKEASIVKDHFDAINSTAYLNGKPSVSSMTAASRLVSMGIDAISQATSRDQTRTTLISTLLEGQGAGVNNILLLTGDATNLAPQQKNVYDMDSSLMLYEARHLRDKGVIHATGGKIKNSPRPFLGAAINPFTTPENIPIRRLKQKMNAGADFIQTQLIFDMERFKRFMHLYCEHGLDKELFLLAGIPVVISKSALAMIPRIPGVYFPEKIAQRLENADDLRSEGVALARELIEQAYGTAGVCGVHLMLFGTDHTALPEAISALGKNRFTLEKQNQTKEIACHYPA